MKDSFKKALTRSAYVLGGLLTSGLAGLYSAWVSTVLWTWFVTPVFGMRTPSPLMMWGIGYLAWTMFDFARTDHGTTRANQWVARYKLDESFSGISKSVYSATLTSVALFEGWVIHLFV